MNEPIVQKLNKILEQADQIMSRNFKIVLWVLAITVLFLGHVMVIREPYRQLRVNKNINLTDLQNRLADLETAAAAMNKYIVDQSLDFTAEEKNLLSMGMPDNFSLPDLTIQLESMAARSNFLIDKIELLNSGGQNDKNAGVRKMNFVVSLQGGDYTELKRFVSAIEKSLMPIEILAVSFKDAGAGAVKYEMKAVAHYYPIN